MVPLVAASAAGKAFSLPMPRVVARVNITPRNQGIRTATHAVNQDISLVNAQVRKAAAKAVDHLHPTSPAPIYLVSHRPMSLA